MKLSLETFRPYVLGKGYPTSVKIQKTTYIATIRSPKMDLRLRYINVKIY